MKLAPEGRIIIVPLILIILFMYAYSILFSNLNILLLFFSILLLFSINFFRDPYRLLPEGDNYIISPADGKIVAIKKFNDPDLGSSQLISIFLNVFNVHVNRMPIAGSFVKVDYKTGKFLAAFDHNASDENERTEITINSKVGLIKVKQIAGLIARRIICYASEGNSMEIGGRLGFIRFGSRTDLIIPDHIDVDVKLGQKVIGNKTIIGTYE